MYGHAQTLTRNLPTANFFLAEFTVDTTHMPALVRSTSSLEKDVRNFLRSANQFYGLAREPARRERSSGVCGLNLYTRFEDFMTHPKYHVSALCTTIEEQIEDVDGEETHKVLNHLRKIRALLRTSEPELQELDRKDEYN